MLFGKKIKIYLNEIIFCLNFRINSQLKYHTTTNENNTLQQQQNHTSDFQNTINLQPQPKIQYHNPQGLTQQDNFQFD